MLLTQTVRVARVPNRVSHTPRDVAVVRVTKLTEGDLRTNRSCEI